MSGKNMSFDVKGSTRVIFIKKVFSIWHRGW